MTKTMANHFPLLEVAYCHQAHQEVVVATSLLPFDHYNVLVEFAYKNLDFSIGRIGIGVELDMHGISVGGDGDNW
jgi:hypothetical protein